MDTFELLPSLAQGELAETSAPELVAAVFRSRASGTLWLEAQDGSEIRLFFRAGDMCGTGAFSGFQTLAHVLLVNDWVNALDIDSSRGLAEEQHRRHGEVLVEQGLLTPEQLRGALAAQHRSNLAIVLALTAGKYDWRGWEPPPAWAREVVVDPVGCIVDALEAEPLAPRRQRVIAWLGDTAARLSVDWPELQGRIALEPIDRRAAALLALPRRLGEFVQASRLPHQRAEALLAGLLLAGGVEPQPGVSALPGAAAVEEPAIEQLPMDASTELEPLRPEEPPAAAELLPSPDAAPSDDHFDSFPTLSVAESLEEPSLVAPPPYEEPEPPPAVVAPPPRSKPPARPIARKPVDEQDAFARLDSFSLDDLESPNLRGAQSSPHEELALSFDAAPAPPPASAPPPAFARAAPPPLDGSPDEPLPGLESPSLRTDDARGKEMRMKLLQRGLRNLGSMPGPQELPAAEGLVQEPRAAGAVDAAALNAEERKFVEDVRSRLRAAAGQSAYERLGLTPQASSDQIKTAYLQGAKRYHPDRASSSPALEPLQAELQTLFSWMKEAYDLIATAEARARYDANARASVEAAKPTSRKDEASAALKQGDALLKKRDFEAALVKLRRAAELDPNADVLAALAWGLVCDPKQSPAAKEEAASLVNRALRASGPTARTYYVAGVIWRTRDPDSAVDAFRKALELDANHPDASLELRLLESRRGKSQKSGGGGVLSGLLFGKRK